MFRKTPFFCTNIHDILYIFFPLVSLVTKTLHTSAPAPAPLSNSRSIVDHPSSIAFKMLLLTNIWQFAFCIQCHTEEDEVACGAKCCVQTGLHEVLDQCKAAALPFPSQNVCMFWIFPVCLRPDKQDGKFKKKPLPHSTRAPWKMCSEHIFQQLEALSAALIF